MDRADEDDFGFGSSDMLGELDLDGLAAELGVAASGEGAEEFGVPGHESSSESADNGADSGVVAGLAEEQELNESSTD